MDVPTPIKALNSGPLYMEWFSFLFFLSLCTRISSEISKSGDGKNKHKRNDKVDKIITTGEMLKREHSLIMPYKKRTKDMKK